MATQPRSSRGVSRCAALLALYACISLAGCTLGGGSNNDNSNSNGSGSTGTSTGSAVVTVALAAPVFYAGQSTQNLTVTVSNDATGDVLTPTATTNTGACTTAACGTFGSASGSAGSYTIPYTPPSTVSAITTLMLTVRSSLSGSIASTVSFNVYPASTVVVLVQGGVSEVFAAGGAAKSLTAVVYNDPGTTGNNGAQISLLANGYVCPPATGGATICGTLAVGGITSATTNGIPTTTTSFTYTPPKSVPLAPYDRPMLLASAKASPAAFAGPTFTLSASASGPMALTLPSKLNSVLTGSQAITLQFRSG